MMNISEIDFEDFNIEEIVKWPLATQLILVSFLVLILQLLISWFYLAPKYQELQRLHQQEDRLKAEIIPKINQVQALPKSQAQLAQLKTQYKLILKQLPIEKELSSLLETVNDLGSQYNLTFERIDWGGKQPQPFFYRLPLNIELIGSYNNVGQFSEAIAKLPRIVILHDVSLQRINQLSSQLRVNITAYTYQLKPED